MRSDPGNRNVTAWAVACHKLVINRGSLFVHLSVHPSRDSITVVAVRDRYS